jgi:hypothetical protein
MVRKTISDCTQSTVSKNSVGKMKYLLRLSLLCRCSGLYEEQFKGPAMNKCMHSCVVYWEMGL